ncbi:MAG TPA: hypothetical protein VJ835_11235, partial [Fimbriimonadaceae bacterium]|nr:hypothetical protein [Fimbriimonadaceae bacterium]
MRKFIWIALVSCIVFGICQAATIHAEGSSIFIYGIRVLTLRSSVGNFNPKARAALLAQNLEKHAHEGTVTVRKAGKNALIKVDGHLVLTVTVAEAKLNKSAPISLAATWASNIRRAFQTPPLKVATEPVRVPLGANRVILASGTQFAHADIQVTDPSILKVGRVSHGVAYKAIGYGKTEVIVSVGNIVKTVSVSVLPIAANLPQNLVAVVS